MCRCSCCDRILSDYEATLRRADNGEFVDICTKCLKDIPIQTIGREDLKKNAEQISEDFNDDLGPMWFDETTNDD